MFNYKANLNQYRRICIVLGNESCDLDSTISTCVYAYFLHSNCSKQNEILYLPLLNNTSSAYHLRTEVRWFLKDNYSNVICIDDINLNDLYHQRKLDIILVDHNYLHSNLNEAVIEIIDHHQISKDSILLQDSSKIKIELVGSCCTLIAEKILSSNFIMTEDIAYLLTGPIIFDTINFSTAAGRVTEKDRQIYMQLRNYRPEFNDDTELYNSICKNAGDTAGLSIRDLLQKDAKKIIGSDFHLIMCSLPMNYTVEELFEKLKTVNEFDEFLSRNENANGIIITSIKVENEKTKRQIGFYMKNIEHIQPIYECIQGKELNLDLTERAVPINEAHIKLFDQHNIQQSRKQILPFVEKLSKNIIKSNAS